MWRGSEISTNYWAGRGSGWRGSRGYKERSADMTRQRRTGNRESTRFLCRLWSPRLGETRGASVSDKESVTRDALSGFLFSLLRRGTPEQATGLDHTMARRWSLPAQTRHPEHLRGFPARLGRRSGPSNISLQDLQIQPASDGAVRRSLKFCATMESEQQPASHKT